jgi:hypothetical protein
MIKMTFSKLYTGQYRFLAVVSSVSLSIILVSLVSHSLAAQITQTYIEPSSSSAGATQVIYDVNFNPTGVAGAFVIDFCSNSPVVGQPCVAPSGMSVSAVSAVTSGFSVGSVISPNTLVVVGPIGGSSQVSVQLEGITNPEDIGTIYARIVTYNNQSNASGYDPQDVGPGVVDSGSVAMAITGTIGVSGVVLESMTFCVSSTSISANCGDVSTPVLVLGEELGDAVALIPGVISEGDLFVQISTNASSGAIVRLKSSAADCGGLILAGDSEQCYILPAQNLGINPSSNDAKFGVMTADATNAAIDSSGTLQPVAGSGYNSSTYTLNYTAGNLSGVTSLYGDAFLDTNGQPANNKNMQLTFGASANNGTPAGVYSAHISLIAVGKF